jgi:ribose-phosphate pyrophosphokinase
MATGFDIVSGGVFPKLTQGVAKALRKKLVPIELKRFANGERYVRFEKSLRRKNLYVVQSFSEDNGYSLNDAVIETLLIIDAAKRASANEITVVLPILPYARQDRKARNREPISASVMIRLLQQSGADRILSVDLHSAQTQAIFNGPFDHLIAQPLIAKTLKKLVKGKEQEFVVVSPDTGRAKESEQYADELGVSLVHLPKSRDRKNSAKIKRPESIDGVRDKECLIIDDMVDTGGTIVSAAETLKKSGAKSVAVCATHGILSNNAAEKFKNPAVNDLYLTNTISQNAAKKMLSKKLHILDIAPTIAEAIRRIELGESLAGMFGDKNNK